MIRIPHDQPYLERKASQIKPKLQITLKELSLSRFLENTLKKFIKTETSNISFLVSALLLECPSLSKYLSNSAENQVIRDGMFKVPVRFQIPAVSGHFETSGNLLNSKKFL